MFENDENIVKIMLHEVSVQDCFDLFRQGYTSDGVYMISPHNTFKNISVFCEMSTGGWTRIQRREDGSVNFNVNWTTSVLGFGNIQSEHWLGKIVISLHV